MAIEFYRERDVPYGCFSSFSKHSFMLSGQYWLTAEHYFRAQKFPGSPLEDAIRLAPDPMTAKRLGQDRAAPLRSDWEAVKDDVMRAAVRAKFDQHPDIRAVLLGTGDETLVEAARSDSDWGSGPDGTGRNRLGKALMEIRDELR